MCQTTYLSPSQPSPPLQSVLIWDDCFFPVIMLQPENTSLVAHRAPIPEEEPLPGDEPEPLEDPVPNPDPIIREPIVPKPARLEA